MAATLSDLLEMAQAGAIKGLVFVVEMEGDKNNAGMAGEYKRNPAKALQATFMLERYLARTGPFARAD